MKHHTAILKSIGIKHSVLFAILVSSAKMPAATFFWDGTDTGANANGGSGTWDTTSTNWDSAAAGGSNSTWPTGSGNTATFGGVGGTVTVSGAISVGKIIFDVTGYTLAGSGTITLTGTPEIAVTNAADLAAIQSIIAGAAFQKTGAGTLTLSGNNTQTGVTTISAGTLVAASNNALGTTGAGTTVTFGAALALQGGIAIGAEALNITGTGVSNRGALRNLSGNNTFGGSVTITDIAEIQSDADTLTLTGGISGTDSSITFDGAGAIVVNGVSRPGPPASPKTARAPSPSPGPTPTPA